MSENCDMTAKSVVDFIAATAAKAPTPGGGSVAGVVGGLATALGEMSLAFTRGKKAFAEHEEHYAAVGGRLAKSREMFIALVAEDIAAYSLYQQAGSYEGPDKSEKEAMALAAAINVPREMAKLALAVLADMDSLVGRCNKWLITDLAAGAVLAEAVVKLCDYNIRVNAPSCSDKAVGSEILASSAGDCDKARQIVEKIEAGVRAQLAGG